MCVYGCDHVCVCVCVDVCGPGEPDKQSKAKQAAAGDETKSCGAAGAPFGRW